MRVGIVGAGRVGVLTGLVLFEIGHEVTLFDIERSRVTALAEGAMPFFEPDAADLLDAAQRSERWAATGVPDALADCEVVLIAVPTPSSERGEYTLGPLRAAVASLREVTTNASVAWRAVLLRSTVLPGTTEAVVARGLAVNGATPCSVGYLPEFLREGSAIADAREPDRIVIGADDPEAVAVVRELFASVETQWFECGVRTAELLKVANNAMLSMCVSFSNEIARVAETAGATDASRLFEGLQLDRRFQGTPRAGIADYFAPGPGFGGSCLGKDLAALIAFAEAQGEEAAILKAVAQINRTQPLRLVDRIDSALDGLDGRHVLVLGLAFKPGTDDSRESIALPILRELSARGAVTRVHDPAATRAIAPAILGDLGVDAVGDDELEASLDASDAAILLTSWPEYLSSLPRRLATRTTPLLFVDSRGSLRDVKLAACVSYLTVGEAASNGGSDV